MDERWVNHTHVNESSALKGKYYRKSLIIILLVTCIPTILIGISSHQFGVKQIQKEMNQTHLAQLQQTSEKVDEMLEQVEIMINQWASSPVFDYNLQSIKFEESFLFTHELYRTLLVMNNFNPMIKQVSLFLPDNQILISGNEGIQKIKGKDTEAYNRLFDEDRSVFLHYNLHSGQSDGDVKTLSLVHKLPLNTKNPYGAFIVDLNIDEVVDVLMQTNPGNRGYAFILREDGSRVTALKSEQFPGGSRLEQNLERTVMQKADASGSFVFSDGSEDYAVAYLNSSSRDWIFASVLPLKELIQPVTLVSRTMIIMNIFSLAIAVILSWVASRRIYHPIQKLMTLFRNKPGISQSVKEKDEMAYIKSQWEYLIDESDMLKTKLRQNLPMLRESFMMQFINGHLSSLSEDELRERYERLGTTVEASRFFLILIHLSGIFTASKFFEGDEQLLSFSATNIISELTEGMQAEVLNFQDLTVGVLLMYAEQFPAESIISEASEFANKISLTLRDILKVRVTAILTRPTGNMREIPDLLESARQTFRYRDMTSNLQIMGIEVLSGRESKSYYPFAVEKEIVQYMRIGDVNQALERIRQFIGALQEFDNTEIFVQQGLLQLLGSLRSVMAKSGFDVNAMFADTNLYEKLMQSREPSDAAKWFEERILAPYAEFVLDNEKVQEEDIKLLIEQVSETLCSNYNQPISLESVADEYNVTSYMLSKWFKNIKGVNFIDYLTAIRMSKAKELLVDTDMKIFDIAEKVGYQPSYFNRAFKKSEGMTPKAYRDKSGANK